MFSGIVECTGVITHVQEDKENRIFTIASPISKETYTDQSIAHDGVCLTVVQHDEQSHSVVAIRETLDKTKLGTWVPGTLVNLERSVRAGDRMDGHFVQGHVDTVATCMSVRETGGSWYFDFETNTDHAPLLVTKGSICIDGVSLTLTAAEGGRFSVAIIPYTFEHTGFNRLKEGDRVNIEFDILGKYILQYLQLRKQL